MVCTRKHSARFSADSRCNTLASTVSPAWLRLGVISLWDPLAGWSAMKKLLIVIEPSHPGGRERRPGRLARARDRDTQIARELAHKAAGNITSKKTTLAATAVSPLYLCRQNASRFCFHRFVPASETAVPVRPKRRKKRKKKTISVHAVGSDVSDDSVAVRNKSSDSHASGHSNLHRAPS